MVSLCVLVVERAMTCEQEHSKCRTGYQTVHDWRAKLTLMVWGGETMCVLVVAMSNASAE